MALDRDRIRPKLDDISRSIHRLRRIHSLGREALLADEDAQDIARSRLLTAVEAALNICYHACAKELGRVPDEYSQCFAMLGQAGMLSSDLSERLAAMARFRNRLVHLYWDIDYGQVFDFLDEGLRDLDDYIKAVAQWT